MSSRAIVLLSFILLFMFSGTVGTVYLYSKIPQREREVLVALYNCTDGDNWVKNYGWKTPPLHSDGFALPGTEKDWYGVTCNDRNTMVGDINLSSNQLTGTIPPGLANLSALRSLDLSFNQLTGTIPPGLANLSNLWTLVLQSNQLTGTIPPELGQLSKLRWLSFDSNQLMGTIPPELGQLSELDCLSLASNQLTGTIPSELGQLSTLQWLFLHNNQLTGTIPPELGKLAELKELFLSSNQLMGPIPPELGQLSKLQILYLSSNKLTKSIPNEMENLVGLSESSSDFRWNGLHTDNEYLRNFLNSCQVGGNWEDTQTTAPKNVHARRLSDTSAEVSWTTIAYTGDKGGYMVFYILPPGGSYTLVNTTETKSDYRMQISGLKPLTNYYFVVQTRTEPHENNQNTVDSEYSDRVSIDTPNTDKFISGRVYNETTGKGIEGVKLFFSPSNRFEETDSSGDYWHNVEPGWSGTVEPMKNGYSFEPAKWDFYNVVSDQRGTDFKARLISFSISGKVTSGGEGIEGVTLTFAGANGGTETVMTDADGSYSHEVPFGWSGRGTPVKEHLLFYPSFIDYVLPGVNGNIYHQDYQLSISLVLNITWKDDRTLIIRKYYGEIELIVSLIGVSAAEIQKFIVYRKEFGGTFQPNKEFAAQEQNEIYRFAYNDEFLEKGKTYIYVARVVDLAGKVIGESKEKTIQVTE